MQLKLINKIIEAKDTKTFEFNSDKKFTWVPGQYIYITLPKLDYPDERGDTRHFTISSSPTENKLQITTRIRQESGYKKTLDELPIGTILEGKGPQGGFVFTNNLSPNTYNLFLAGGIGITPFRSFIKYSIDKNINIPMHLIYSNSDSDFVFKKELDKWQQENENLKIIYFDSSIFGHLNTAKLSSLYTIYDIQNTVFYVVGPNKFVNSMEEILENLKVLEDNIETEKFTGY